MTDFEDIYRLYMDYAWAVDQRDFELARSTFSDDCTVVGTYSTGPIDEYLANIREAVAKYGQTMHLIGNLRVELEVSRRLGTVQCYAIAHHLEPVNGKDPWVVAVCYNDRVRRDANRWKVENRTVKKLWEKTSL